MKRMIAALLVLGLGMSMPAWAKSRSGRVTMEFDLGRQPADQEVRLWIPYPVSDKEQSISDITFSGDYGAAGVRNDRSGRNKVLYASWPKKAGSRKLTLSFQVERQEVT